jgi:polysaccharide chain length determinant protein (PEP-CTERM system associated)
VVPGKKYKPEDFLLIAWRRRWFILVPLAVLSIGAIVWTRTLPNVYKSEATILIVPPRVSSTYVKSTISEPLTLRLESLRQRFLGRTQLERIIQDFDLYPEERKTQFMEQVVRQMSKDVNFEITKVKSSRRAQPNSFTIGFVSQDPRVAMRVAERLASLFVNANLEERALQAGTTNDFMQNELEQTKNKLQEQERKLEAFYRTHGGALPNQRDSNMQAMESVDRQMQQLATRVGNDNDRRAYLLQVIPVLESTPARTGGGKEGAGEATIAQKLEAARQTLRNLELKFKPDHPDLVIARRNVKDLQARADAEAMQQPLTGGGAPAQSLTSGDANRATQLLQYRSELQSIDRRLKEAQGEAKRLEATRNQYRGRLDASPAAETELTTLTRDRDALKEALRDLQKRAEDARLALNMEQSQVSEQFRVVDAAKMPERPSGPDRLKLSLYGLFAGLALGLGIAGLLEYRDTSLRTEDDVIIALSLPVVALVPTMTTVLDRQRSFRYRMLLTSAVVLTLVVSAAALVWKLRLAELWTR